MLSLLSGFLMCTRGLVLPGLFFIPMVGLPVLGVACMLLGVRKGVAFLALTDLFLLFPVFFLVASANGTPIGLLLWRVVAYGLGLVLALVLLGRREIPDWFLPMRGRWARKLLGGVAVFSLAVVICGDLLWAMAQGDFWLNAPRWAILLPLLTFPYLLPAWDVLARGWEPR